MINKPSLLAFAFFATSVFPAEVAVLKSAEVPAWKPILDSLHRVAANQVITEYDLRDQRAEAERVLTVLKGKPVILVAMGKLAAQAAREIMPEAPLVFCMVPDPASIGLVGTLNTAGVSYGVPVKNQLAAFRLVYPRGIRVGVIYNVENTGKLVQEAQKATNVVRLILVERAVTQEKEIPEALRALLKGENAVDALWIPPDPILMRDDTRHFVLAETLKAAKPVYTFSNTIVQEGALVSDGPDFSSIGEEVADFVGRLAAGEHLKGDLAIPKADLVINKKIADKLKLEISAEALKAANKVF